MSTIADRGSTRMRWRNRLLITIRDQCGCSVQDTVIGWYLGGRPPSTSLPGSTEPQDDFSVGSLLFSLIGALGQVRIYLFHFVAPCRAVVNGLRFLCTYFQGKG